MKRLFTFYLLLLFSVGCSPAKKQDKAPERIVSMAPSITEILFALEQGDKVVAVTSYCDYPQAVKKLPKIGGLFDSSIEQIYSVKPDLVIHLPSQSKTVSSLRNMGIDTLEVNQSKVANINNSISIIAQKCGCSEKANAILKNFPSKTTFPAKDKPKVLIVISRDLTSQAIDDSYLAGKNTWYNDLLQMCGAENVFDGKVPYPSFSIEGAMVMNPDIIIELIPEADERDFTIDKLRQIWRNALPEVNAVKNNRIYMIKETYAVRPGPRYPLLQKDFLDIINNK